MGSFFLTIGVQIQGVAVGWQMYSLTKDPLYLGLIGLAEALPFMVSTLPGGNVADTYPRKKTVLITVSTFFIACVALLVLAIWSGTAQAGVIGGIFGVIVLTGIIRGFSAPARAALGFQLVKKEDIHTAASLGSTVWQTAAVTGPALGGLLYGWGGSIAAYGCSAASALLALLFFLSIKANPEPPGSGGEGALERIKNGLQFFLKHRIIFPAMLLDMLAVLFGGAVAVLPIFCEEILHVGPQGLGILRAMPAVGGIIAGIWFTSKPIRRFAGKILFVVVILFGITMIAFALSRNFWLSASILLLSGGVDMVSVVIRNTILQSFAPEAMRGRLSAINYIFVGASNELGAFESGVAARLFGLIPSVVGGGCITILITLGISLKAKKLRNLEF